jgi:hypothetical protein
MKRLGLAHILFYRKDRLHLGNQPLTGLDLIPVGHEEYALVCRIYQTPDGMRG